MKERVAYIDGLRGIAVLAVVLFHAGVHNPALSANPHSLLSFVLRQGCHGVDLFFILSGFCLAYPTLARVHSLRFAHFDLAAFAARRVVRIIPPYYAAITIFAILGWVFITIGISLPAAMDPAALSAIGIMKQFFFLDGGRHYLNESFWTLPIEFRWYFVFPVLLLVWIRAPKAFAAIATIAIIAPSTIMQNTDLLFLPLFMLGIVAADLHARGAALSRVAVPAAIVTTLLAALSTADGGWYFIERGPLWGLAMFCVVVAVGSTPLVRKALSGKVLVAIGTASYGIYLIHEPIVTLIERYTAQPLGSLGTYILSIAGGVAVGVVFSLVAEQPFVGSRLRGKLLASLQPAMQSVFNRLGMHTEIDVAPSSPTERIAA